MTTAAPVTHLEETRGVGIEDYSKQLPCDPQFTGLTTTFRPRILQAFGIALRRGGKRNSEPGKGVGGHSQFESCSSAQNCRDPTSLCTFDKIGLSENDRKWPWACKTHANPFKHKLEFCNLSHLTKSLVLIAQGKYKESKINTACTSARFVLTAVTYLTRR